MIQTGGGGGLSQLEPSRQETYFSLQESVGWSIRPLAAQLYSLELNKGVAGLPTVNHEASSQAGLTGPHTWDQSDNTE